MVKAEQRLEAQEKRMEIVDQKLEGSFKRMEIFDQKLEQSIKEQREFASMQSQMNKYFLAVIKKNSSKS